MSPDYRSYLITQGVVGAAINGVLNAGIGWGLYHQLSTIPLRGQHSITADVMVTSFLLPVLVCGIATPLIRADVRKGRLPAANWIPARRRTAPLPRALLLRALALGLLCTLVAAPVTIWFLSSIGLNELGFGSFVLFKTSFAAALGGFVTPGVAALALRDVGSAPDGSPATAPTSRRVRT